MYVFNTPDVTNAKYIDINTNVGLTIKPDLLTELAAVKNSIFNILMTPLGTRYRLPEFGSALLWIIGEPKDLTTENQIRNAVVRAIQRWETRVTVDINSVQIKSIGVTGYGIEIPFMLNGTNAYASLTLNVEN